MHRTLYHFFIRCYDTSSGWGNIGDARIYVTLQFTEEDAVKDVKEQLPGNWQFARVYPERVGLSHGLNWER